MNILLVEDNPGDVELFREALSHRELLIHVVEDGVDAISFLSQKGAYANMPPPALVVLDINLPRKNGHEVLAEIRADPRLTALPVVMFTTSDYRKDIIKGYQAHVSAYVTKPGSASQYRAAVKEIESFWLSLAKLPNA